MNYNELHEHKKGDAIKWIIAFTLIAVLFVGVIGSFIYVNRNITGTTETPETEVTNPVEENPEAPLANDFSTVIESTSMLRLASGPAMAAADNSVTKTITATVNPDSSTSSISWNLAFANPSSTWATGKNISDYVELGYPNAEDTRVVTLTCKQAFGEQMILTATANMDSTKSATCTIDYYKRIVGYNKTGSSALFTGNKITAENVYSFGTFPASIDPRAGSAVHMNYGEVYTYSDYTKDNTATVKFYVQASASLKAQFTAASNYVEVADLSQFYVLEALTGLDIYSTKDGGSTNYLNEGNLNTAANKLRNVSGDFFTLKIEVTYANTGVETFYETFTLGTSSLPAGVSNVALSSTEVNF